jgi:hypothetical protein
MAIQSDIRRRFKDETGKRYGKLKVLCLDETRGGQPYFSCRCDCGRELSVRGANLRSGNTGSCGCSRRKIWHRKLAGRRIGPLFVWGRGCESKSKWFTYCVLCGRYEYHTKRHLMGGKSMLCLCLRPTHNSWRKMIERCTNRNDAQFAGYGGSGITVCPRWRESFTNFFHDMKPRPHGTTIHRIKGEEGYHKKNCRWATYKEQAANRKKPRRRNAHPE